MVAEKNEATLWRMQDIFYSLAHINSAINTYVHTGMARTLDAASPAGGIWCHNGATRM